MPLLKRYLPETKYEWLDILFLASFAFAAWYLQNTFIPNRGGVGLELPFNNLIYGWMTIALGLMIAKCIWLKQIKLSKFNLFMFGIVFLLLFPFLFNTFEFLNGTPYKVLALGFALIFMLAIQQLTYRFSTPFLFVIIVIAGLIQLGHGLNQHYFFFMDQAINNPGIINNMVVGSFQQVNILASFLALSSIILLYLHARYSHMRSISFILIIVFISLAAHIVVLNSDTGRYNFLLSVTVSSGVIAFLYRRWELLLISLLVISLCTLSRAEHMYMFYVHYAPFIDIPIGLTHADQLLFERPAQFFDVFAARPSIYYAAWQSFLDSPWFGHGIGSYFHTHTFIQPTLINNVAHLPFTFVPSFNMAHPHNELLYWMVESGVSALFAFILLAGYLFYLASKSSKYGWVLLLMLLPLATHAMLEYPFASSSLHFLCFIMLITLIEQRQTKTYRIPNLISGVTGLIYIGLSLMIFPTFIHTYQVQTLIAKSEFKTRVPLEVLIKIKEPGALDYWYNQELQYKNFLAINTEDNPPQEMVESFISFAKQEIKHYPFPSIFEKLLITYKKQGYETEFHILAKQYEQLFFKTNPITFHDEIKETK